MIDRKVLQHDWVVRGFGVRSERSARVTAKHTIFWEPSALVRIYKDAGRAPQSLICKVFEGCECWNQSCLLFICKSGSFHKKTLAQLECIIVQPLQHCFANSTLPAQQLIYVGTIQGKPKPRETRINCQRLLPWEPRRSAFSSPFDFLFFT